MKENENLLMSPLWILHNKKKEEKLDRNIAEQFKDIHELKIRKMIYDSLKWAEKNASYEFSKIFERMPNIIKTKYDNAFIYNYLIRFKGFMENEEYGLLTDDRPTNKPWEQE
ncbi:hypothetical protein P8625_11145 [Tenacibaculum tangerinum]|uniref:Uncharacterized protein n=1 Tax=Tenacibaculum tangerinum TaxID=3038772 RepID=A0ABY8L0M3_9FLAO|nr:hypothetical protein [Tenacibaculum tangerinum]WGH74641.1 hypothetical protein P8625_11145 [Tenacibaculum tangerinum]